MARQRIHNSRAGRGGGNSGASWISYSDMMAALLLVFVLMLTVTLYQHMIEIEDKTLKLDAQQSELDEKTLQIASQQVTIDHQNAKIVIIQTALDEKETELNELGLELENKEGQLIILQNTLADWQTKLISLESDLANKEIALNSAYQALADKEAALATQADRIEDMVGVRADIISALSSALTAARLRSVVDEDGNITLDSSVMFDSGKSVIKEEGKAFLDRFIPVYLDVLTRPEYSGYLGQIIIEGHTDDTGSYENNLKLSQQRALEVSMYVLNMYPADSSSPAVRSMRTMLEQILTATGRATADMIYYSDGTVNRDASRRVEFKFSLKDAEMVEEMNRLLQGN